MDLTPVIFVGLVVAAATVGCQRDVPAPPASAASSESFEHLERACDSRDAAACERLAARLLIGAGAPLDAAEARRRRWEALSLHMDACTRRNQASCDELPEGLRTVFADAPKEGEPPPGVLPLDLPKAAAGAEVTPILSLDITADGGLAVDGSPMASEALAAHAKKICSDAGARVVIRADRTATHGRVIELLDLVKQAGCTKIAFGVQPSP